MSVTETDFKDRLRNWVKQRAHRPIPGELHDDTPILEQRLISSMQVMELLLFIEQTTGKPVSVTQLKPGAFRSINSIYQTFVAAPLACGACTADVVAVS